MKSEASPGALPLYLQISEMLIRDIAAGRLRDGARLPPERGMAASLNISVGTLRKALSELEGRGLVERRQGSGNYVRARAEPEGIYAFFRLERPGGGGLPSAQVLDVQRMLKPTDLPEFGTSPEGHRIRRIRYLDRLAVSIEEIWLDGSYAERIEPDALSDSLYLYYREKLNLWITGYEDAVTLSDTPDWSPDAFRPRPGMPCAIVERQSRARDGAIAEVSRNWFDGDRARYVARMR